jgi:hypothetical protein
VHTSSGHFHWQFIARTRHATHRGRDVAEMIASLDALVQMGRQAGLRAHVQESLSRILEAALQIRQLPGGKVDRAAPLVVRVDDYEVSYSIDVDAETIQILSVEPFQQGRPQRAG